MLEGYMRDSSEKMKLMCLKTTRGDADNQGEFWSSVIHKYTEK